MDIGSSGCLTLISVIVCHCKGISSRRIEAEVAMGASTVAEVGDRCGAGTGCGGCVPLIETILRGRPTVTEQACEVLREEAAELVSAD